MNHSRHRSVQLGLLAKDLVVLKCHGRATRSRSLILQKVVDRLGLMHGLPQKIGQLLAFSELESSDAAFTQLTENKPSLSPDEALAAIQEQIGLPLLNCFRSIEPVGIGASIGQVHRARLLDARSVAVKVQYPDIAEHIAWDLQALGWLAAPIGDMSRGFDLAAYRREIGSMLECELDYAREAAMIRRFREWTADWQGLQIPEVVESFSGPRCLTTTWVEGCSVRETRDWSIADRSAVASTILRLFLKGLFEWGLLHADPNPGNYRFLGPSAQHGPMFGLLDFGCVKAIPPNFSRALGGMFHEAIQGSLCEAGVWNSFLSMGFNSGALQPVRSKLVPLASALCAPFLEQRPTRAADWPIAQSLSTILGEHRMMFRAAGPASLLFVLRAFQGVLQHLRHLDAPIPWRDLFVECALPGSQQTPPEVQLSAAPVDKPLSDMKADFLHIRVSEASAIKVALTFDVSATDHLDQLVPAELRDGLRGKSIDLVEIAQRSRIRGHQPGELFSWDEGAKAVRVWLA